MNIRLKLCLPEFSAGFRCAGQFTVGMTVPKTSVHEYAGSVLGKDQIRLCAGNTFVKAKPVTQRMKMLTDGYFWRCILGPNVSHHSTSDFL
jgi:hypothetical protein